MEKYGQYRDKGSGIAPFFPTSPASSSIVMLPWAILLVFLRIPLLIFATLVWIVLIQWAAPPGTILRKANLWCIIGIPSIWWVDLQVDGVRRGSLGRLGANHMPSNGSIIAASYTSPLDMVYLATIFDPIFTQSYEGTRLVRQISLPAAVLSCFSIASKPTSDEATELTTLAKLSAQHPNRIIAVFPEGTTSNGRGILRFTHSLLSASPTTRIFPVSIRYSPQDVVTPLPGFLEAIRFLWRLNSQQTHTIRTRIGTPVVHVPAVKSSAMSHSLPKRATKSKYEDNFFDTLNGDSTPPPYEEEDVNEQDRLVLDAVADTLARLGRVKRVSLGVEEKATFVQAWYKNSKYRK